jgi:hypothetical protein
MSHRHVLSARKNAAHIAYLAHIQVLTRHSWTVLSMTDDLLRHSGAITTCWRDTKYPRQCERGASPKKHH